MDSMRQRSSRRKDLLQGCARNALQIEVNPQLEVLANRIGGQIGLSRQPQVVEDYPERT
jgi:hypothetical protein